MQCISVVEQRVLQLVNAGWVPDLIIERHGLFSDAGWRLFERADRPQQEQRND